MLGQRGEQIGRRERDMQEEADLVLDAALAQRLGERQEVIVVHPDHVVGPQESLQPVGEHLVDAEIAGHVAAGELHEIEPVVQDRPQHPVGEAVVEFLEVAAGNIGGDVGDAGVLDLAHHLLALGHVLAAPAEPDALVALEERAQHDLEAARSGAAIPVRDADAVRHHHYPRHDRSSHDCREPHNARRGAEVHARIAPAIGGSSGTGHGETASTSAINPSQRRTSAGRLEVFVDAGKLASDRHRLAVEIRHHLEGILVGLVVADENRRAARERRIGHQVAHRGALVEGGIFDFQHGLAGEQLERLVGPGLVGVLDVMDEGHSPASGTCR